MRRGCRLRVAEIADGGLLRAEPDERLQHAGGVRRGTAAGIILSVAEHHRPRGAAGYLHGLAHALLGRHHRHGKLRLLERNLTGESVGRAVRRRLAPGMGDHGRAAPVKV